MPREPFLVKSDDHLWTLDVGLAGGNQIRLVAVFPLKEVTGMSSEFAPCLA